MAIQKFSVTVDAQKFSVSENLYITATAVAPILKVAPVISGTSAETDVLTVTPGTWQGITLPTLTYQWQSDGVDISGETGTTYTVTALIEGTEITVIETATNAAGSDTSTSNTIAYPVNLIAPSIAGDPLKGSTLTATPGTWTGIPAVSITGQWLRDNVAIAGETGLTYLLVAADEDTEIDYRETATSASGIVTQDSNVVDMWTPSQMTGGQVWCDPADSTSYTLVDSKYSQLDDKLGNGNDFTQASAGSRPDQGTQNGNTSADLVDGSTRYMQANALGAAFGLTDPAMSFHLNFKATADAEIRTLFYMDRAAATDDYTWFGTKNGNFIIEKRATGQSAVFHEFTVEDTNWHSISIVFDSVLSVWLDGEKIYSEAAFTMGASWGGALDRVVLGAFQTSFFGWREEIGEFLITNTISSDLDCVEWARYSMTKWLAQTYVFSPAELTGIQHWSDPNDSASVTAATIITELRDKSDNTYHWDNTGGSTEPTLTAAGVNSRDTIDYGVTLRRLRNDSLAGVYGLTNGPGSIHFSVKSDLTGSFRSLIYMHYSGDTSDNWFWFGNKSGNFVIEKQANGQSIQSVNIMADDTNWHTFSLIFSDTLDVWVDGERILKDVAFDAGGPMAGAFDFLELGAGFNGLIDYRGESQEMVFCNQRNADAQVVQMQTYMMQRILARSLFTFDFFIGAGQSNMVGPGDSGTSPATTQYTHWGIDSSQVMTTPADDPFQNANTGSIIPSFLTSWTSNSGNGGIFINMAVNGSAILEAANGTDWWGTGDGTSYTAMKTAVDAAIAYITDDTVYTINDRYLTWIQGEQDADNVNGTTITAALYQAAFTSLIQQFTDDFTLDHFAVSLLGLLDDKTNETDWAAVRTAQIAAIAAKSSIAFAMYEDANTFPDKLPTSWMAGDNIHYLQVGLNDIGTVGATNLYNQLNP